MDEAPGLIHPTASPWYQLMMKIRNIYEQQPRDATKFPAYGGLPSESHIADIERVDGRRLSCTAQYKNEAKQTAGRQNVLAHYTLIGRSWCQDRGLMR